MDYNFKNIKGDSRSFLHTVESTDSYGATYENIQIGAKELAQIWTWILAMLNCLGRNTKLETKCKAQKEEEKESI